MNEVLASQRGVEACMFVVEDSDGFVSAGCVSEERCCLCEITENEPLFKRFDWLFVSFKIS